MLIALLLVAGCSAGIKTPQENVSLMPGRTIIVETHPALSPTSEAFLPALPELGDPAGIASDRSASSEFDYSRVRGNAIYLTGGAVLINNDDRYANFTPGAGELAWSIFRLPLMAGKDFSLIQCCIAAASDQELYFGLANYTRSTWEWHAASLKKYPVHEADLVRLELLPRADYLSPTGSVYFVVACWNNERCDLLYSDIYYLLQNVHVSNLHATQGTSAQEITITWDNLEGATGYQLYYRVYLQDVPLVLLADIDGGAVTSFSHTLTSPVGMEAVPGTSYMYYVSAKFNDGSTSWLSALWDVGYLAMP